MSTYNRREFLTIAGGAAAGMALGANMVSPRPAHAAGGSAGPGRPNIVVILVDDMGFSDIGCYGSEIATPNIDRLAAGGVRFTQCYNMARCCPTRASLLTGLYPHQADVGMMIQDQEQRGYRGRLAPNAVTIAEALKAAGYTTLMSGKWHVGESRPHWPCDRGFDEYYGLISGASSYWRLSPGRRFARDNEPIVPDEEGFFMTDAFTDNALAMLDRHGRSPNPFLLYLAYTAPHWPLHAHEEDIAKYRGRYDAGWEQLRSERHRRMIEMGIVEDRWRLSERDGRAWDSLDEQARKDMSHRMAVYAAQIERMDRGVGRVMDKLRQLGQADNTLVLFMADNGGCNEIVDRGTPGVPAGPDESFLSYGHEWANASNTPFRRFKKWAHEGGIATPLVAHWPAGIRQGGQLVHEPAHVIDIMPTALDLAGAAHPATLNGEPSIPMEGVSLAPALSGRRLPNRTLYWEHMGNRAVRQGNWKLVAEGGQGPWELYDLQADRTETDNLIDRHPEKARQLDEDYQQWALRAHVLPKPPPRPRPQAPVGPAQG